MLSDVEQVLELATKLDDVEVKITAAGMWERIDGSEFRLTQTTGKNRATASGRVLLMDKSPLRKVGAPQRWYAIRSDTRTSVFSSDYVRSVTFTYDRSEQLDAIDTFIKGRTSTK